ncbi:peptidase [Salmonella enterica]|uniref:Peptidase n=1 Tax=Salmonella enterica TaxID=28901 RepID=A0A5V0SW15_SALER|nr:peptidase [Salmonella enterica]EBS4769336.1 peptidase [Salmonella enterica subsp. enterica serovar Sandiego]ECU9089549.1 peptidase [Salmonella enterica subsp. enterica serovar Cotham]EDV8333578.1 peptidase [Salmonella enterica subsp. enterica serovar Baildon]EDX6970359.1 peptidase [Salmonella enterica subsp. enterica]
MTTSTAKATLAVFAPGTHTAMDGRTITFTPEDCIDLANSYDPSVSEAPFVIGHPSLTAPAYGWAERLEYRDGIVYAAPRQVNPAFAEAFNAGSYKKRSLSIYQPDSPGNPKPGHFYARHVGFLGAIPPGVKGLPDAQFAEASGDNGPLEFALPWEADNLANLFQSIRDWVIQETTIEQADSIIPQWRIQSILDSATDERKSISPLAYAEETNVDPNKKTTSTATDFAERETALAAREARLAADEEVARTRKLEEKRTATVAFADGLVKGGSILPRQKTAIVEVLMNLSQEPLSFSEGETTISQSPEALLREILSTKPAVVNFSEKTGTADDPVDFADASALATAAQNYQAEQAKQGRTISMTDAVNHVKKGAQQ